MKLRFAKHFILVLFKMSERNETKWICEYCTYENYPSSLKCTMCRGHKPFGSEDIYRLHGNDEKISNCNLAGNASACESSKLARNNSWACDSCTFINPSREHICRQCGSLSSSSVNTLHEQIQPLKISHHSDIAQSLSRSRNNSPPASITNIENIKRTSQMKWSCFVSFIISYCLRICIITMMYNFRCVLMKTGQKLLNVLCVDIYRIML